MGIELVFKKKNASTLRIKSKKNQAGWEYIQQPPSFHFSHRASTRHFHTHVCHPLPGGMCSHITSHDRSASHPLICAAVAHLSFPTPSTSYSGAAQNRIAGTGCSPGSPPPLPLHGNRSSRKASPPLTQMKRGHKCQQSHSPPLSSRLSFLLKATGVHSSFFILHLTTTFQGLLQRESNLGKS